MCSNLHGIRASVDKTPLLLRSPTGSFFGKLLFPVLHQKQRIYHLLSQVNELLIKLAWSTVLGVMKLPKVQTVDLILSVWLCDLQVYQSSSPHSLQAAQSPSLHSLQQLSPLICILNGSSQSFQLPLVEGGHGYPATLQKTLQTHNGDRRRANSLCWQRKVLESAWWILRMCVPLNLSRPSLSHQWIEDSQGGLG